MLSPFVRRKMILALYRYDLSKEGLLTRDDFELYGKKVTELLKVNPGSPAHDKIMKAYGGLWKAYIAPADKDNDGVVTIDEFLEAMTAFVQLPNAKQMILSTNVVTYAALDLDGDGKVSREKFAIHLRPLGTSEQEAQTAFQHLDRDGDGFISIEELAEGEWEYWNSEDRAAPGNWYFGSY